MQKLMDTNDVMILYDVIKSRFHVSLCFVLRFETCSHSVKLFILLTDLLQAWFPLDFWSFSLTLSKASKNLNLT